MTVYLPGLDEKDLRKVILAVQQLGAGRSNAIGSVTLTPSAGTTTVTPLTGTCSSISVPILVPTTANAAAEVGNGTMYISAVTNASFTITHANSATTGRTFLYALHG
jgi:hypothetical protein